jgi:O-antigen/teichoic acid export membrane protein
VTTLRRNVVWTLAGNVVFAAMQWVVVAALARLASPEAVGLYSFSLALTTPLFLLGNLNLRAFQATDAAGQFRFTQYLGLRSVLTGAVAAGLLVAVATGAFGRDAGPVVAAITAAKSFEALSDVCYGLFQQRQRMERIATSLVLRGVLGAGAAGAALATSGSTARAATSLAAAWLAVLLVHDLPRARRFVGALSLDLARESFALARRAAPLGLVMAMLALSHNLPIYAIQRRLGAEALGFYAAVAYFFLAGRMLVDAVSQSMSPALAVCVLRGDGAGFRRLLMRGLALGLGIGVAGVLVAHGLGGWLLRLVYGPPFQEYQILFVASMAAAALGFEASFLGVALTASRRLRALVVSNVVALAVMGVACAVAIPRLGLLGAPAAIALATGIKILANAVVLRDVLRTLGTSGREGSP